MVSEYVQRKDSTCGLMFTKMLQLSFIHLLLAPELPVVVEPPEISGNASEEAINLTCTATLMDVATTIQYQLVWLLEEVPVDQSDARIMVLMYYLQCDVILLLIIIPQQVMLDGHFIFFWCVVIQVLLTLAPITYNQAQ